ncbi:MAG: efflux RND transporter periplasmic adaptor subunit [Cyclobacteriaceae bacterium]|nr:efflux RND transporter periplasmic adaptor subunit [Cyclobacteriaceae bacterium]
MKTNLYFPLLSVVVIAGFLAGCSATTADKKTQLETLKEQRAKLDDEIKKLELETGTTTPTAPAPAKMAEVNVAELKAAPFDFYFQTQGSVEAVDNILVSARTMGIITRVLVVEGSVVKKGETLAQIDNTITLKSIDEVKSSLEMATTVYERQKNLWDQKIGTEVAYLQTKTNKEGLEKKLATLNEQLDMCKIKSPIDGSVDEVDIKIGQNAAPGAPAFRVVSSDKLKLKANVSEAYVTSIKKGNNANLSFPDINENIDAKVTFVGRTINQLSRTFPVEVAISSKTDNLRPNMTGNVKIVFKTVPNAITVPINIVQEINGEKVVYIAEKAGETFVAKRRVVIIGGIYGNMAEVKSGLAGGDKLITVGFQGLEDGEPVIF